MLSEVIALRERLTALSEALAEGARATAAGAIPDEALAEQVVVGATAFAGLRERALAAARVAELAVAGDPRTLPALEMLARRLDERGRERLAERLIVLEQVGRITPGDPQLAEPVSALRQRATALRDLLVVGSESDPAAPLQPELSRAADDMASLIQLADEPAVDDTTWDHLHQQARAAFGPELATAAARQRLIVPPKPIPLVVPPPGLSPIGMATLPTLELLAVDSAAATGALPTANYFAVGIESVGVHTPNPEKDIGAPAASDPPDDTQLAFPALPIVPSVLGD
ncbi:MAG: hypothetical protein EXR72_08145 [Myxococcales bacterium]|nr:hypothetical protein [Myxococcales bacterium]